MPKRSAKLERYLETYAEFHRHPINQLTHKIAIPLIVFHIVAMLSWVSLFTISSVDFEVSLGHLAYLAVIGWYLSLDTRLAVIMAVLYALCFPLAAMTPHMMVWVIAIVAWTIQLAGHVVWEKKQPAFLTNLLQALIGPLYFVDRLLTAKR